MDFYLYTNIIGTYVFDKTGKTIAEKTFKSADYLDLSVNIKNKNWTSEEKSIIQKVLSKNKNSTFYVINQKKEYINNTCKFELNSQSEKTYQKILSFFTKDVYREEIRNRNIELVRYSLKNSPIDDTLIIQAVSNMEEIDMTANILSKRLREWYELYFPEVSKKVDDHKKFSELVSNFSKDDLMKNNGFDETMGYNLKKSDLDPILKLAKQVESLYKLKDSELSYLDTFMDSYCPNLKAICGTSIASKLISLAGSLEKLSKFPSSTIQTLGAEKAMFRHLKSKSKPPKYGIILMHPIVASAGKDKGKAARILANKISLASKIDYFKGDEYKGYELREEVEKEVQKMKN
jgi:nucleolar protein 56